MQRRSFISKSAATLVGLPFCLSTLNATLANAQEVGTDPYADYLPTGIPGVRIKFVWKAGDSEASGKLIRLEPGAVVPGHLHSEGEYSFVVNGSFTVANLGPVNKKRKNPKLETYSQGEYIFMPKNTMHGPTTALEDGNLTFVFTSLNNKPLPKLG